MITSLGSRVVTLGGSEGRERRGREGEEGEEGGRERGRGESMMLATKKLFAKGKHTHTQASIVLTENAKVECI